MPVIICLHIIDGLVDDAVVAQLHTGFLHRLARTGIGAHVEADDERLGGGGELHVGRRDAADAAGDDLHLTLVDRQIGQRLAQRLVAALHVGLQYA